jgi:hypothetical protein
MASLFCLQWGLVVIDEAHRLKNHESATTMRLNELWDSNDQLDTLILTGTPLQNNIDELFNLMMFINPAEFDDREGFMEKVGSSFCAVVVCVNPRRFLTLFVFCLTWIYPPLHIPPFSVWLSPLSVWRPEEQRRPCQSPL